MKRIVPVVIVLLLAASLGYNFMVFANPSAQQTPECPTYQINLVVDLVNSNPTSPLVGASVVTRVHVVYNDGTPVTLVPETISFLWTGTAGQKEFDLASVVYAGEPGFYTYTETLTQDMLQTLGAGKVTIAVMQCSCSDVLGNRGPVGFVGSDETLTPSDNSNLFIGPQTQGPGQPFNWLVPLIIAILLIIALLLFFMRKKGQKKK